MIWNSITDIAIIYNILCSKRRNKGFYDVLTFIPNQDTVHCEPSWWKTTWNLMLNDPILNVLFLCFMSLTLTPTNFFFVFYFFCRVQEVTSVEQLPLPKRTIRTTAESKNNKKMVFCYRNCFDLLWEEIVLVNEKNFWNSSLNTENFQKNLR